MDLASALPTLLGIAWLVPLASFTLIVLFGPRMGKHGIYAGHVATGAILTSCALSWFSLLGLWVPNYGLYSAEHHSAEHGEEHASGEHAAIAPTLLIVRAQIDEDDALAAPPTDEAAKELPRAYAGNWYTLGKFGSLEFNIGYYVDALTVVMFAMVTFIASCIHFYAIGYMHDELHDITDHEVQLSDGHHLHRHGRFYRFFQYLSLFCFSMLGIVIAGNIAMVFVFWELVGICSYFLIGFYYERKSASTAANKAFIVNRVGDFGMIIGLAALFASLGTFNFGDVGDRPGLFSQVRPADTEHRIKLPDGMVTAVAHEEIAQGERPSSNQIDAWRGELSEGGIGRQAYWLLVIASLGIFCGCVGKSAQFPLHVWLPDAMEGPTPVSALVHSATMVAAGVYLVGRFFPVFPPEALLVIAITGAITLLLAATIAITATDIKRVLAYSTVSQLGYMMLSLGIGGWMAGMFHLITHAFFKSLLFMCSGSVIHACHTNEMPKMGGLRKKMPITAYTMLVGCLAIAGAGLPFTIAGVSIGLSGYYSKDAIIAQAMSFKDASPVYGWLFYIAAIGAAMTSFYMFRLWYMTFAGKPRDHHIYDHAHESPPVMTYPLIVLAVMATIVGWPLLGLTGLLEQARPLGTALGGVGVLVSDLTYVSEHASHAFHTSATLVAFSTAAAGFLLATVFYLWRILDPAEVAHQFRPIYKLLVNKWYFDELYDAIFVQPVLFLSRRIAEFDKKVLDWLIDHSAIWVRKVAMIDDWLDRYIIDGVVNWFARWTYAVGQTLRMAQTGMLRQYVLFIVVATVGLFVLITYATAGGW